VVDIYLPLSQLLTVLESNKRESDRRIGAFLGEDRAPAPFIIGIAGSVAVGKSTTAGVLQALLRGTPDRPSVDLLVTDGFLYPNAVLEARGLMARKGFPESYDQTKLIAALGAIRAGEPEVQTPVYSHLWYDIVPGETQVIRRPDVVIVEGLNVLQVNAEGPSPEPMVASDFFDFSIYVDAAEDDIARWFTQRLCALWSRAGRDPDSYFHSMARFSESEAAAIAAQVWSEINLVNLRDNVAPTRGRAHLILEKDGDHRVRRVLLRRP
jgi:type I pantothenate kinase